MSLLQKKSSAVLFILLLSFTGFSCFLFDFEALEMRVKPSLPWEILPSTESCLEVDFLFEVSRIDAEKAFTVSSKGGIENGDFVWEGNSFRWRPLDGFRPRERYRLLINGKIKSNNGEYIHADFDIPFWVQSDASPPSLRKSQPGDGQSTICAKEGDEMLILEFTETMDPVETFRAFSILPSINTEWKWNEDFTEARIIALKSLKPCESYNWNLDKTAAAADGARIDHTAKAVFFTDLDKLPPQVLWAKPIMLSGGQWVECADNLNHLDRTQSIGICFSKEMDAAMSSALLRLEPFHQGVSFFTKADLLVFSPARPWPSEEKFTLTVSREAKDNSGIQMAGDWKTSFTTAIPWLEILELETGDGTVLDLHSDAGIVEVVVGDEPDGLFRLSLRFSDSFDSDGKVWISEIIRLSLLFPKSLPPPVKRSAAWLNEDTVTVEWSGLKRSNNEHDVFYQLFIPSGIAGPKSATGLFMENDFTLWLEAGR